MFMNCKCRYGRNQKKEPVMGFSVEDTYPTVSEHLKSEDVGQAEPIVTITEIGQKTFDEGDAKLILHFAETEKTLVLNKTNGRTIAGLYGDDTDGWKGKQIKLFVIQTDFGGKTVPGLRVRSATTAQSPIFSSPAANTPPAHHNEAPPPNSPDEYGAQPNDEIPF